MKKLLHTEYSIAKKLHRYLFEDTAEVTAGPKKIKFTIHTDLASARSKFFTFACSPAWRNDKKPIDLTETDPRDFSDYLQQLYQGKIVHGDDTQEHFIKLVRLYRLADKLGDLRSTNEVIDNIIKYSDEEEELPDPKCINLVMGLSPEKSPLRRLVVDYYVQEIAEEDFDSDKHGLSLDFLAAVTKEFIKHRASGDSPTPASEHSTCHYHQHDDSYPKCEDCETDDGDDG